MADTEVDFVINNLTQLLQENTYLIAIIEDDVKSLLVDLKSLQAFLKDATKSRSHSEILKHLVKQLSAAVYGAENFIDKFVIEAKIHQEKRGVRRFLDVSHVRKARHCSAEIKSIREKLKETRRDSAYGLSMSLQYVDPKHSAQVLRRAPVPEEDEVVGFDEEADKIIKRLCEGSADLEVIPIVGMPGIGKTTLANKVFKDSRVEYTFFNRIWVYVSQSYTRRDLFLNIINHFTRNTEQYRYVTEEALAEEVRKHLMVGKYLIVLDDIWTIEACNDVKIALPNNQKGSRVLLTTRDSTLANHCSNNCPHHLKFLTESECWVLLQRKVFHKERCPPDLEELGRRIAMKCMGLPLAILVIAGALIERGKTKSEWERVHQGVSERITSSDFLMTKNLVQMSYDSLPFNLKVCFLYCSVFPRGFEIPARKIVLLWISEGFIGAQKKITLETAAEEYLKELVSKSLLMVTRRTSNGQIKTCRMHDILHEFCTLEAREENLFEEIKLGIEQSFPRNQELATFRRLCIDSSVVKFISTKPYGDGIRSFLCFSSQKIFMSLSELKTIPKSFPLLRVFDIESILFRDSLNILHKQFIELYHLRYIALSSDSLKILPKFMGNLWNLQTLIILTQQKVLDIQADICNMPQLRHLHTNASAKLRPSAAVETNKHGALQTLSTIEPESCTEHVFARCQNLKKLGIRGKIPNGVGPLLNANKLKCLEKLKLIIDHPLAGGKLHLPSENILPMSLKEVTLSGTMLEWADMVIFEPLPALEVLKLKEHAFTGDCWELKDDGFPCLKVLWIEQTHLVTWRASSDVFPRLERLVLRHLDKLEEVPIQLAEIVNLQMMELVNTTTTAVESARKIQAECEDMGYTGLKLYISDCN